MLLSLGMGSARATAPGENGKIAFDSHTSSNPYDDIHTVVPSPDPDQRHETNLTSNPWTDMQPAWSPDGTKIAYSSQSTQFGRARIWAMNEDGSGKTQLTPDDSQHNDEYPTWSPDGSRIAWIRSDLSDTTCDEIYVMNADGSDPASLGPGPECPAFVRGLSELDWSPDGTQLTYAGGSAGRIYVANADNTAPAFVVRGYSPNWSPSGEWLLYVYSVTLRVTRDGSVNGPAAEIGSYPEWSPDGRMVVLSRGSGDSAFLVVHEEGNAAADGTFQIAQRGWEADWQPLPPFVTPPGYPRPRGAGPMDVSLVPAHDQCFAPNSSHGPPLSFGSCAPPAQSSANVTVGTPDANGHGARFVGRATLVPRPGDPSSAQDEADVRMVMNVSDVRCRVGGISGCDNALDDYTGSLRETFDLTITDKDNGGSGKESATLKTVPYYQYPIPVTAPCAPTADPAVGSTCAISTTAEAVAGNIVQEGKRNTWALGKVQVWDAGEDGNPNTDDNTLFVVQGLFVP
jgi:hypothetical protein